MKQRALPKRYSAGGATTNLILILGFIGAALLGIKLFDPYFDNMQVKSTFDNLERKMADERKVTKKTIRDSIMKQMGIDNVKRFERKQIEVEEVKGLLQVSLVYTSEVELFTDFKAVMTFRHQTELEPKK